MILYRPEKRNSSFLVFFYSRVRELLLMEEKRYIISEAAEKTGIEAHVLRYWEEELGLDIPRNEMGHRYYTENQLQLFRQIKELKDSGFQLKAVKTVLEGSDNPPANEQETRTVADVAAKIGRASCRERV